MIKKPNHYKEIIALLLELRVDFPSYNLGKHLSTALYEEGDVWGMSDKDMLRILTKYKLALETDFHHDNDDDVNEIIKQGMRITLYEEEEDDGEIY